MPPVFIVVCQNTSHSKLVFDYVAGWEKPLANGEQIVVPGKLPIFSNEANGRWATRPNTILVDSEQLESGDAMSDDFKKAAAAEIEEFKRELRIRFPGRGVEDISDEDLLREVMNTVGKAGKLGENVKCVVSVSMLTEGWDANTVTHILGVRAFGTQLLCEQVVGRGLRRLSHAPIEKTVRVNGEEIPIETFSTEYAEVFGVPFSFIPAAGAAGKTVNPPDITRVRALEERADCEIRFPRIVGYRSPAERRRWRSSWPSYRRDVKDGKADDASREPEVIKAFRDTWALGIHSYLTYLRDRLVVARDLLSESGSIFVQIGDENAHLTRSIMDETFGSDAFVSLITFTKTAGASSVLLPSISDFLIWYCKNPEQIKYTGWTRRGDSNVLEKRYVVETNATVVKRCLLMTTDPGDLVLDPTCGSGTTAHVAEQWGRPLDHHRHQSGFLGVGAHPTDVRPLSLLSARRQPRGRQERGGSHRSHAARAQDIKRHSQGFVYKRVPHVTLKSIANNPEIDTIHAKWQEKLEPIRAKLNALLGQSWEEWEVPHRFSREAGG